MKALACLVNDIQYDDFYQKNFESSKGYKILVDELNYADNCHTLEEQLGCSLDVIINACINGFIARYYGDWENAELDVDRDMVSDFRRKCFTDNYANEYFWKDYKKTWWLKSDRSE